MAKKFKVEIVTPEKLVFSEEAESLIVPAERGYLGVLAGHAPLLCTLQPGEIRIRGDRGDLHFATSGGFMEATPKKASLLTESAEEVAGIDAARAQEGVDGGKRRPPPADKAAAKTRARAALERAQNRLNLAAKYKK